MKFHFYSNFNKFKRKMSKTQSDPEVELTNGQRWIGKAPESAKSYRSFFMMLLKQFFNKKPSSKEHDKLLWTLYTRAWLGSIPVTITRIGMKLLSLAIYQKPDCIIRHKQTESDAMEQQKFYAELGVEDDGQAWGRCIHYNLDLMEQSIDYLDAFVWILLISAFIVDILCYKYRHFARYYMFYQMAHLTVTRMIPNP